MPIIGQHYNAFKLFIKFFYFAPSACIVGQFRPLNSWFDLDRRLESRGIVSLYDFGQQLCLFIQDSGQVPCGDRCRLPRRIGRHQRWLQQARRSFFGFLLLHYFSKSLNFCVLTPCFESQIFWWCKLKGLRLARPRGERWESSSGGCGGAQWTSTAVLRGKLCSSDRRRVANGKIPSDPSRIHTPAHHHVFQGLYFYKLACSTVDFQKLNCKLLLESGVLFFNIIRRGFEDGERNCSFCVQ